MKLIKFCSVAALAVSATFFFAACGGEGGSHCGPTRGEITEVTDGDTLKITTDSDETFTIRLLLTDTPEVTKGHDDCYGQAAKAKTMAYKYKEVTLSYESEDSCTDMYGRYLAYVTPVGEKLSINEQLVAQGYARVCRINCDESRYDEFAEMELQAQDSELGVWNQDTCPGSFDLTNWGASGCVKCRK